MKKFLALVLSLVLCMSMFAACGSNDANQGGTNGGKNTAAQEFRTYLAAEPSTLDISRRSDTYSSNILANTVEGLVRNEDHDGKYVMSPGDAEKWEPNGDGTVWTFHLNKNAKWSDGEPVTAQQYVYSLQRSADPATGCPNSFFLQPIKNFSKVNDGTLPVTDLGVEATDDNTLVITLEAAMPSFLDMCSGTIYYPLRKDIVEKYGDKFGSEAENFIGNGPFKIQSWTHNSAIVLVKNENYWDAKSVKLEKVTFNIMTDENTYYNAFQSGELDYVSTGSAEWLGKFADNKDNTAIKYPTATLTYSFYNNQDALFKNVNVRKAFTLSIDREELNQMCFSGLRTPTYGWVVPTISVGETNFRKASGDIIKDMQADLKSQGKTAKDLLIEGMKELGLGEDPSTLKVTFSLAGTSDWYRTLGDYLQQTYLKELGVKVEISFAEWGIFYDNVQKGNYQIGFMGWGAYYNDPYDVLSLFVSSTDAIETGWSSTKYDELIAKGAVEMDAEKRIQDYKDAEHILIQDECVASPLATANMNIFVKSYVKNYPQGAFSNSGLKYVEIVK
ncbi:MAG: peptide ABC transporter substrate-binding protein [Clostridiaceae bacterium]|nr:peptide ABC transporter substrate-binding protein [Clostridiaceae bacterium]